MNKNNFSLHALQLLFKTILYETNKKNLGGRLDSLKPCHEYYYQENGVREEATTNKTNN